MKQTIPEKRTRFYQSLGKWSFALYLIYSFPSLAPQAFGQTNPFEVSGTISSSDNKETLPGANILLKGTTTGAVSNMDGEFSIVVPSPNSVLVISSIGYVPQEITVGNRSTINVLMEPDITSLSEVVVVGYGTQERAKVTGAISSVTAEDLTQLAVPNLASALQGRAPGVNITNSGAPGTGPLVRIRGIGTVGNTDPLYVIDGVPAGGLNQINNHDIESIEILKDASAAAIYGSRAANGVILVTTKKGKMGLPQVSVNSYVGVQTAWKQLDLLNREQYLAFGRDLLTNNNDAIPQRFSDLGEFANVDTDWQGEMFRSAPIQDHNVAVSGGNEGVRYNVSVGYFNQEGIMRGTDFERISFRANTDFKISNRISAGQTFTLAYSSRNNEPFTGGRSQLEHMVKMVPYIPVRDASRLGGFRAPDRVDGSDPENPVLNAVLRTNRQQDLKILGTGYVDVDIYKGFKYKFLIGVDMNYGTTDTYSPMFDAGDFSVSTFADISQARSTFFSPLVSNQFTYAGTFGKHSVDALAVIEQQTSLSTNLSGGGRNLLTNDVRVLQGVQNQVTSGNKVEYALISYIGRINYDYDQKYLLSASIRRDGGSRFGPGNKIGYFPAFSAGWRISEESFMQGLDAVSDFKIRASYGETGNDRIGDYAFQGTINSNFFYNFDGNLQGASTITSLANAELKWESTAMTNVGLDLGLFNDRLNLTFEWFDNETKGMILGVPIPHSLGYDGAPVANVGTVSNKGIEASLGYRKFTGDFTWSVDANFSTVQNELVSLGTGNTIFGPSFQGDSYTYTEEGQPIAYFYGWIADGLYQQSDESLERPEIVAGDIRFRDLNEDGVIDADDRTYLGHYLPDFTYGLNLSAEWKNFDVTMFIQGVQGNEIFSNIRYHTEGMTRLFNASAVVLDRWTPTNTDTDVPRAVSSDPNRNSRASSRFIEDGSYMRIKNLAIGYTLPSQWLGKTISNVRVYVSSQNLLTVTNYSGYDPEIGVRTGINSSLGTGIDYGQFPQPRTFIGGLQVTF
jgi:TonB-linked SusC/RagA family outer membrane protein